MNLFCAENAYCFFILLSPKVKIQCYGDGGGGGRYVKGD